MKRIIGLALLFFVLCFQIFAQKIRVEGLTDSQIVDFFQKANSNSLTEKQVETLALSRGYSFSDILKMKERYTKIKGETQKIGQETQTDVEKKQLGEVEKRTIKEIRINQDSLPKINQNDKKVFGSNLFSNTFLSFEPNLRIPTPKDYQVGVDDEIRITLTGYTFQQYLRKISPEGTIQIENLAPLYVNGLNFEQLRQKIRNQIKILYPTQISGDLLVEVSLGTIRTIKVTVVGEAKYPGTYTISSFATVFNALYAAGGPHSATGSFREIRVIRDNKLLKIIDLYDFLLKGIQTNNILLKDQDIIFIPPYQSRIEIEGEVMRKGIFELTKKTTLGELIELAGGFSEKAYKSNLTIQRSTDKELKLLTVPNQEINTYVLQKGDKISVGAILNRYENKVEILGAVFRPGEYALNPEIQTVRDLIRKAEGLREDAFFNRAYIKRERENLDPELISFDLGKLIRHEISDIVLKRQDIITIKSIVQLREERYLTIEGAVNIPGKYEFVENMTVEDLVSIAGGFTDGATSSRIEISRRIYENKDQNPSKTVDIYVLETDKKLKIMEAKKFILQPFDQIFVRVHSNYETQKRITILGQISYPGTYSIESETERISSIMNRAGGLKKEAYPKGAKIKRDKRQLAINLENAISNPNSLDNLFVVDGDTLEIPVFKQTVNVSGQVQNPVSITYESRLNLLDYIDRAGGFTDSASVAKIYVKYSNGFSNRNHKLLFINRFPKIEPGATIYIPKKAKKISNPATTLAISSGLASLALVIITLINTLK